MDTEHLKVSGSQLTDYMEANNYSDNYINTVKKTLSFITERGANNWMNYDDICRDYVGDQTGWVAVKRRSRINLIAHFDLCGIYPERKVHTGIFAGKRADLCPCFNDLLDSYVNNCRLRGLSESTCSTMRFAGRGFLGRLENLGYRGFDGIKEADVITCLTGKDSHMMSHRYCQYIKEILAYGGASDKECRKAAGYIPHINRGRKNIQYLTESEVTGIRETLAAKETGLSFRDKAIIAVLFYTGMRRSDVANLKLSSLDWEHEKICIRQQKTGNLLSIPLIAEVGNAVFDYIVNERPATDITNVFVTLKPPFRPMRSKGISATASKLFDCAGIRINKGDRRGTHIFRHHLVSDLLANDISQPVISSILGHSSPRSLDDYLNSDFHHLKDCALSVENYSDRNEEVRP